jgi:predicted nucleotidyltransferase
MTFAFETTKQVVHDYVADVKSAFPIEHACLYGSYAKGTATEHSDIGLCFFLIILKI